MNSSKAVYLFGYSGHAYVVIESLFSAGNRVLGYLDIDEAKKNPYHISYCGFENEIDLSVLIKSDHVFPAVGSNKIREKLILLFERFELKQINAVHSTASVASNAGIQLSTLVGPKAIINPLAQIGKGCIINSGAIVEHECIIGDHTHIGPGAVLSGNVQIGKGSFIGANAVVRQGQCIGDNTIIGAGSVVVKDIPDNEVWIGNPAIKMR